MFNLRKNLFSIKYAPSLLGLFNFDRLRAIAEQEKDTEKCARNIYANDLTHDKKRGFLWDSRRYMRLITAPQTIREDFDLE